MGAVAESMNYWWQQPAWYRTFPPNKVCQLGLKNQAAGLAQCQDFTLYRQAMFGRQGGRELKITRKVEWTDELEKTEVSKSWKSRWDAGRVGKWGSWRREGESWMQALSLQSGDSFCPSLDNHSSKCSPLWQDWQFERDISNCQGSLFRILQWEALVLRFAKEKRRSPSSPAAVMGKFMSISCWPTSGQTCQDFQAPADNHLLGCCRRFPQSIEFQQRLVWPLLPRTFQRLCNPIIFYIISSCLTCLESFLFFWHNLGFYIPQFFT